MKRLLYLANIRLPTEKAHGIAIMRACEAFARAGLDVTLIVPRRSTTIRGDAFAAYGIDRSFRIETVPAIERLYTHGALASRAATFLFFLGAASRLLVRSRKDTVLYTREVALTPLALLGFPVILEIHHVFGKSLGYAALARLARGLVVISPFLKEKLARLGIPESRMTVEPSGVDLATFAITLPREEARTRLDLPRGRALVAYTGNFMTMGEEKGLRTLLKALREIDAIGVAAGGSEKECARYAEIAREYGVADRAVLRGFMPQRELAVYQQAADVLVMPFPDTPHFRSDMSPVKMFEYMASGRPIVSSDLPTIRSVLSDDTAVFVPPGDASALARAVADLLADPLRGERLAARAKETAARYAWDARSGRVLQFIRERIS
ncbi:glycosyltransferase [Patescibacteria group bacterium]|nr:glycosyltransferase [Patescibacteria group bacterium]